MGWGRHNYWESTTNNKWVGPGMMIHKMEFFCLKCHWLPCRETVFRAPREHVPSKDGGPASPWLLVPAPQQVK